MEINSLVLLGYAVIWTIFYWFLSQYIAELSRKKWTTWVQSEESDDVLVEALQAVIEEIEIRMHDKLQQFQDSFFGSDICKLAMTIKSILTTNLHIDVIISQITAIGFFEHINLLYGTVSEFCNLSTCPDMVA